ncbi:MAG: hypothetical protein BGO90_08770 [Legionella sp. 40-6]|nr:YdgA family protein [Legionella sp.]OJY37008.1 MAG: hypothetical protein BGO90_08770 [Legionella sp. 40-6]
MKKLAGLIIILAALVLGGYYVTGYLTEKNIRKNVEAIDKTNASKVAIKEYKRGWFTSDAVFDTQMHFPEQTISSADGQVKKIPAQDYNLELPIRIYHGPVILSHGKVHFGLGYAESVIPFPKQYDADFNTVFTEQSQKPQLDLSLFVNFLNQSTFNAEVPAFNLFGKADNLRINWLGLDVKNTMTPEMDKLNGGMYLKGVQVSKQDMNADLDKLTVDYDLKLLPSGLYIGRGDFLLPALKVEAQGKKLIELSNLDFKSGSDIHDNLLNTHLDLTLQSLFAQDRSYGPGELKLAIRNLDADILARINKQTAGMQNATDLQRQQALIAVLPEIPKVFAKGAELEISKFDLKLPQGVMEGNLFIQLPVEDSANPLMMMQKIHGKGHLKVPAAAVREVFQKSVMQQMAKQPEYQQALTQELTPPGATPAPGAEQLAAMQADKQLNLLQQNGLVVAQGSDFVLDMTLEQGKLMVNGKPFDASMLKF